MLLFHFTMFFGAVTLLYISYVKSSKVSWIWLFSPLLPFIFSISWIIIKDLGMAYAFFAFALFHISVHT